MTEAIVSRKTYRKYCDIKMLAPNRFWEKAINKTKEGNMPKTIPVDLFPIKVSAKSFDILKNNGFSSLRDLLK